MNFHFANENYLPKVDIFRVISEKPPKNYNFYIFFFFAFFTMLRHEIFVEEKDLDSVPQKTYICKKSELPQNFPHRGRFEHNLTGLIPGIWWQKFIG